MAKTWPLSCCLRLHVRARLGTGDPEEVGVFCLWARAFPDLVIAFGTWVCLRPGPCESAVSRSGSPNCGPIQHTAGTLRWHARATRISVGSGGELLAHRPEP